MAQGKGPIHATTTTELVSALEYMHEPSVASQLMGRYAGQNELGWIKEFGLMQKVTSDEYFHHEENLIFDNPFIASVAQVGATSAARITIKADSHQLAGQFSYPREGMIIELPNGFQGLITVKNTQTPGAHFVDVSPVANDTAAAISYATFTAGILSNGTQQMILPTSAFAEGSRGMEQSLAPSTTVFRNQLQKFSDFYDVTFEESRNETYIEFTNPHTGETGRLFYIKGMADTETRFLAAEEMGLFLQQESGDLLRDKDGNVVKTTRGLIPHARLHAEKLGYTNAGGITMAFYDEFIRKAKANHAGTEWTLLQGFDFQLKNKDFYVNLGIGAAPQIFYNGKNVNDEIRMQFNRMVLGNYTIDMKELGVLSHPQITGTNGFAYSTMAIALPRKIYKDPKTAKQLPAFRCMYKEQYGEGAKDHFKVFETGAYAKSGAKDKRLKREITFVSDKGADFAGASEWVLIEKTS